jgi:hypothetical protein
LWDIDVSVTQPADKYITFGFTSTVHSLTTENVVNSTAEDIIYSYRSLYSSGTYMHTYYSSVHNHPRWSEVYTNIDVLSYRLSATALSDMQTAPEMTRSATYTSMYSLGGTNSIVLYASESSDAYGPASTQYTNTAHQPRIDSAADIRTITIGNAVSAPTYFGYVDKESQYLYTWVPMYNKLISNLAKITQRCTGTDGAIIHDTTPVFVLSGIITANRLPGASRAVRFKGLSAQTAVFAAYTSSRWDSKTGTNTYSSNIYYNESGDLGYRFFSSNLSIVVPARPGTYQIAVPITHGHLSIAGSNYLETRVVGCTSKLAGVNSYTNFKFFTEQRQLRAWCDWDGWGSNAGKHYYLSRSTEAYATVYDYDDTAIQYSYESTLKQYVVHYSVRQEYHGQTSTEYTTTVTVADLSAIQLKFIEDYKSLCSSNHELPTLYTGIRTDRWEDSINYGPSGHALVRSRYSSYYSESIDYRSYLNIRESQTITYPTINTVGLVITINSR